MTGFWTGKNGATAKRGISKGKNRDSQQTKRPIPTEASVINGSLKNLKDTNQISVYKTDRKGHMVISVLFAIGLFLHIFAQAIL